jgi:signal transduction histidine kinase
MTHNFRTTTTGRSIHLETGDQKLRGTLDALRHEVAELRASRERLVLAADTDRQEIERDLHEGVQQRLVALAVNVQLAGSLAESDPTATRALLEEMQRDIQNALDEAAQLAEHIYAPLLQAGGLAAALRSAAVSARVPASVDVAADSHYAPEVARTIFLCWLEALAGAGSETPATIGVREEAGELVFEVVMAATDAGAGLDRLRQRSEALGGRMTISSEPGRGLRVFGSLPISR